MERRVNDGVCGSQVKPWVFDPLMGKPPYLRCGDVTSMGAQRFYSWCFRKGCVTSTITNVRGIYDDANKSAAFGRAISQHG